MNSLEPHRAPIGKLDPRGTARSHGGDKSSFWPETKAEFTSDVGLKNGEKFKS